jgi:internalin A
MLRKLSLTVTIIMLMLIGLTLSWGQEIREAKKERLAVIVGIDEYTIMSSLRYAVADAKAMKELLEEKGNFTIDYYADDGKKVNRYNIMRAVEDANNAASRGWIKTFVFYFSGHGLEKDGVQYLATAETDPDYPETSAIVLDDILDSIKSIEENAKAIVFIDACRNRGKDRKSSSDAWTKYDDSHGLGILYSTSPGQFSYENSNLGHGVYTYYLMEALNGEGDFDGDGYITFDEVSQYVWYEMKEWSQDNPKKEQVPTTMGTDKSGSFPITAGKRKNTALRLSSIQEKVVRHFLGKYSGKLYKNDLKNIKEIKIYGKSKSNDWLDDSGYMRLTGIDEDDIREIVSMCDNLTELGLCYYGIKDIGFLSNLGKLTRLELWGNDIVDINPLRGLTQLEVLDLLRNDVRDLSPLRYHYDLEKLYLERNDISDLYPLQNLTELEVLYLNHNDIYDINSLQGLSNLDELLLDDNNIKDIGVLRTLYDKGAFRKDINQSNIVLTNNGMDISDYSTNREVLDYLIKRGVAIKWEEGNKYSEEIVFQNSSVEKIIRYYLAEDHNPIKKSDLSRINRIMVYKYHENLEFLNDMGFLGISSINVDELLAICNMCPNLESLGIVNAGVWDLTPVKNLTNLKLLFMAHNQITDLSPLKNLKKLESLMLPYNQIEDLSPIKGLTKISFLCLIDNEVDSIYPLKRLKKLNILLLAGNNVEDISPIKYHSNFDDLDLRFNQIQDFTPLRTMYDNGSFRDSENEVNIENNTASFSYGSDNRKTVDYLINKGVNLLWRKGNIE